MAIAEDAKAAFEQLRAKEHFASYSVAPAGYRFWFRIFIAGAAWEREECAEIADRKATTALAVDPSIEEAEASRVIHFAIAADQIGDDIRAREKELRGFMEIDGKPPLEIPPSPEIGPKKGF